MARISGVLKAIALASWREARTVLSVTGQNLFLFIIFVALQPESVGFFVLILAVVMIFPLSADPLEKISKDRWHLWPLSHWERITIRMVSIAFSPIIWITVSIWIYVNWRTGFEFLALVISGKVAFYFVRHASTRLGQANWWRFVPAPPGITGLLMRLHWRELLATLDPYLALLLAGSTKLYQLWGKPPLEPAALRIMSLVIVAAMSTSAQLLIGLDGAGAERYRYLPIRGWQILLAKNLAFLVLLALFVAPLDWISGLAAGVAVLAVGNYRSITLIVPQLRWRFTSGFLVPDGILQLVALFSIGNSARTLGLAIIGPCLLFWLLSIWFCGGIWNRQKG